jgi:hypothetical protein
MINHINVTILARGSHYERFDFDTTQYYTGRNTAVDDSKDFGFSIFCDYRLVEGFTKLVCFEEETKYLRVLFHICFQFRSELLKWIEFKNLICGGSREAVDSSIRCYTYYGSLKIILLV